MLRRNIISTHMGTCLDDCKELAITCLYHVNGIHHLRQFMCLIMTYCLLAHPSESLKCREYVLISPDPISDGSVVARKPCDFRSYAPPGSSMARILRVGSNQVHARDAGRKLNLLTCPGATHRGRGVLFMRQCDIMSWIATI